MPNRILREGILTSERVNLLSWEAEVFYRRLMSVVDDFGRYSAHPALLRAALYPLKLDTVRDANVERLLAECERASLVRVYEVTDARPDRSTTSVGRSSRERVGSSKRYLEIADFRQQVRAKESKYPHPPSDELRLRSACVADAQQVPADAHLDGDGDGDVFDINQSIPPREDSAAIAVKSEGGSPVSGEPFAMRADWQPSSHFASLAKMAGHNPETTPGFTESLGEFIAYWLTQPDKRRTQHEWDHTLIKNLKAGRIRDGSTALATRNGLPRTSRDRSDGRAAAAAAAFEVPHAPQPEKTIDGIAQRIA